MSQAKVHPFTRAACPTAWLFSLLCVLATASVALAQQPNSQVLMFTGRIPGQPDGPVAILLRLYDASPGGTLRFEEPQTVAVTGERFGVRIGDATAGGVPATLFRDNASLWIAFALNSAPDTEIGLRTPITSGGYAHTAALLAGPMVRTLNGLVGDVALAAGPNVTITPSDNTLTIGASAGLAGVAHDNTLGGDGTGIAPLHVAIPLFLTSTGSGLPVLSATNNHFGTGVEGVSSDGLGVSGFSTTNNAVDGQSRDGSGVEGRTNGGSTVAGVKGVSRGEAGQGVWGVGEGMRSFGVFGRSDHITSVGVEGRSVNGTGVQGQTAGGNFLTAGVKGVASRADGTGVWGEANGEIARAVYGKSQSGYAGFFDGKVRVEGGNLFMEFSHSVIITSPNGSCWQIRVTDSGALFAASVGCS